jgi:hypothetical protein
MVEAAGVETRCVGISRREQALLGTGKGGPYGTSIELAGGFSTRCVRRIGGVDRGSFECMIFSYRSPPCVKP